jgi:GMP synthase-like glutamine amidotransferase
VYSGWVVNELFAEENQMVSIVQNDPEVPLGNFRETLDAQDVPYRIVHPYAGDELPRLEVVSGLIVLGGAMGANDEARFPFLTEVKKFIEVVVQAKIPFLGVCLGGQLLADVAGGNVASEEDGEKGTLPVLLTEEGAGDPLFAGLPREFFTFQWHSDTFYLPEGASLLASSPACPRQAFRIGATAYGLQFHPEVTREIVECWAHCSAETTLTADWFVAEFSLREPEYLATSRNLLENFLRIAGVSLHQ